MTTFDRCVELILSDRIEGGYSSDKDDKGNWTGGKVGRGALKGTKFGISAAAYPDIDIIALTRAKAISLYKKDYWTPIGADKLDPPIALAAFDCAVNMGIGRTRAFLADTAKLAGEARLLDFQARRGGYYAGISTFPKYGRGWLRRLLTIHVEALRLN